MRGWRRKKIEGGEGGENENENNTSNNVVVNRDGMSRRSHINAVDNESWCHGILVAFMSYRDQVKYDPKSHTFNNNDLLYITPGEVAEWMDVKIFGKKTPGKDDQPKYGRSSSLEYYKKAISYYMPNQRSPWNFAVGWGKLVGVTQHGRTKSTIS